MEYLRRLGAAGSELFEGALAPLPARFSGSARYPRGSRPTDIALRAPSRSPPGGLRTAFASLYFFCSISALRASYSLCSADSNPRAFLFSAGEGQLLGGGPSPPVLPSAPSGGRFYGEGPGAEMRLSPDRRFADSDKNRIFKPINRNL